MILNQGDGLYFNDLDDAKLFNQDDPTASLYSILGSFQPEDAPTYTNSDGKFEFILQYDYADGTTDTLQFRQANWIFSDTPSGVEFISDNLINQAALGLSTCTVFEGLIEASANGDGTLAAVLDGNGNGCWFNAVGTDIDYGVLNAGSPHGIPAFAGKFAKAVRLYMLNQGTGGMT